MHQHTCSARQPELSPRPRHGQGRNRRKPTRSRPQPSEADGRLRPVIVVGYDANAAGPGRACVRVRRAGPRGTVLAAYAVGPARAYLGRPSYERAVQRAQREGGAILDDVPAANGSVVEASLLESGPAGVLWRLPQLRDAQEIVVGSRAPGRRHRRLRRSVSRRLVATAGLPVVIVPHRRPREPQRAS